MIFRLSQKLNSKLKVGSMPVLPLHENPFADWSAHVFVADRTQYILLSNTCSLYSTVLHGKGITNGTHFTERALSGIRELMGINHQQSVYVQFIAPEVVSLGYAKALDRSVTGSMNDLINHATAWLADGGLSLYEVSVRLNDILLSALARSKAFPYGTPREAFKLLVTGKETGS